MTESLEDHPEVHIRLKHGDWEVEISCREDKIKEVVERVLSSLDAQPRGPSAGSDEVSELRAEINSLKQTMAGRPIVSESSADKPGKAGMTCRGLIERMWVESFFASERPLHEVHDELARRGYNYDRTAVSHSLTDLVRLGILARTGTMRNYQYVQRRPPSENALIERQSLPS